MGCPVDLAGAGMSHATETKMEPVTSLLNLPFATLSALGAGYLAYRLAFVGRDGAHGAVDAVFITTVFAALAKLPSLYPSSSPVSAAIVGLIAALASAAVWRKFGATFVYEQLRRARISEHDRGRNVWESMLARDLPPPAQLRVKLKDGTDLMCDRLADFNDAPMGPCLLGPDGSLAFYVTATRKPGEQWTNADADTLDPHWGRAITFIPAAEIARTRIRYLG